MYFSAITLGSFCIMMSYKNTMMYILRVMTYYFIIATEAIIYKHFFPSTTELGEVIIMHFRQKGCRIVDYCPQPCHLLPSRDCLH